LILSLSSNNQAKPRHISVHGSAKPVTTLFLNLSLALQHKNSLDNSRHIAYNGDTKSGTTDRRLRPQIRLLKDLTA